MTNHPEMKDSLTASGTDQLNMPDSDSIVVMKADSVGKDTLGTVIHKEVVPSGLDGISMPYRLKSDDGVTGTLLFCFFLIAYVMSQGKKFLIQQIKNFSHTKERVSIFAETTAADFRYKLLLLFQTCILCGVCFFIYFNEVNPQLFGQAPPLLLLVLYILGCTVCLFLQWQFYHFIGWVFFDKSKTRIWLESYSVILYYLGFLLFPALLLTVYFGLPDHIMLICVIVLVIFAKILMFFKWLKLFFSNMYGVLYLIVYFCALELVPDLLLFQVLIQINNLLLLKQ